MPTLVRDRLTWLVYLQLGVYGYVLYGIGPSIQLLRDDQGISKTLSGLHGTALALGAVLTGIIGPRVVERLGRGGALWSGVVTTCIGIGLFCVTTWLPVTLFGAMVVTIGGSLIVNSSNTVMLEHHGALGPGAVSEAHATATAVGTFAPLIVGGAVAIGAGWRAGLLVAFALCGALAIAFFRVRVPDHRETPLPHDPDAPTRLPAPYWWAWTVIALLVSVEFSMSIWTSDLLRERVGLSEGAAAAGVTAVVAGMAIGRIVGGRLAMRHDSDVLLMRALALTAAGFALFWISRTAWLSLTGLVICGLGIALHFPLGAIRAIATAPATPDLAAARASLAVGVAIGVGPFLLGALADGFGTHRAFLVVPLFLALAGVGIHVGGRRDAARAAIS